MYRLPTKHGVHTSAMSSFNRIACFKLLVTFYLCTLMIIPTVVIARFVTGQHAHGRQFFGTDNGHTVEYNLNATFA